MKVQDKVLETLGLNPNGLTPTQIGIKLGYTYTSASATVSQPLKKLIEKGLVTKQRIDNQTKYYKKQWSEILTEAIEENKTV